ncbi:MAG: GAF domain-containing protein [Lentisphaerota bacterium]
MPFFIANPRLPETWAELAVPLRSGERVLGVVDIQHKPPQIFGDQDVRLMTTVANQWRVLEKLNMNADLQAALRQEQAARTQLVQSEKLAALGRIVASVAHELIIVSIQIQIYRWFR